MYFCIVNATVPDFFTINSPQTFEKAALATFHYQAVHCPVYKSFIHYLGLRTENIHTLAQIPFLPVSFFKSHEVSDQTTALPEMVFFSSGTTGQIQSRHPVADLRWYEESFNRAFTQFYGAASNLCILALLPSYLEREGSSLIYMVDALLAQSQCPESGYFLHNHDQLALVLQRLQQKGQKTLLIGVTYALLDFIEQHSIQFPELIVMETGGMKGKRREMVREELHQLLCSGFGVSKIHSEYGMTELLSQAYSKGEGIFYCPPWMQVLLRDTNDPLSPAAVGKTGGINIIDLANYHSCSFIATQDLGRCYADGAFEVLGRFDHADIRGCNLLVQ